MTKSIVTDEEVKENEEQNQQPIIKHDQDMEALVARRREERCAKDEQLPEEPEDKVPDPTIEPEKEDHEEGSAPQVPMIELSDADGNIISVPASAMYKGTVDGEKISVPIDKITRSYQIGAAADKRMRAASLKMQEIEQKEQELTTRGQELSNAEQSFKDQMEQLSSGKVFGEVLDMDYQDTAKKLLTALTKSENPEEALVDVLKDIAPKPVTVDQEKIITEAEKKAIAAMEKKEADRAAKEEADRQEAWEIAALEAKDRFETDYPEIANDPILRGAANNLTVGISRENPDLAPWDVVKKAVEGVQAWQKKNAPSTSPKPSPTPRSVSSRASIGKDYKPKTRADIIKEMRRSRGQPV